MKQNFFFKLFLILIGLLIMAKAVFEMIEFNDKLQVLIAAQMKVIQDMLPQPMNITQKDFDFKVKSVYAVVFYGRMNQTRILLRYLEPNVKANGGILDKIVFAVKTKEREDLEYLDSIFAENKTYFQRQQFIVGRSEYREIYLTFEDDDLIFKIDDDIVFISNGTFERMVEEFMSNKLVFLSANVVNHPLLSYIHARLRAIMPFYESSPYNWSKHENETELDATPAFNSTYNAFSIWWTDPKCAAIAHESFFYHVKRNNHLRVYDFNKWDFHSSEYTRWSINFVLMRGKYVNRMHKWFPHLNDDELTISQEIPKLIKRHAYALGSALVVHFSYGVQINYLDKTNILNKYENLSKKKVAVMNQ